MRLVDTHAHLDFLNFDTDRESLIENLKKDQIGIINPATDEDSIPRVDELSRRYQLVWGALGIHPTDVTQDLLLRLPSLLTDWQKRFDDNQKLVAIGEIGLDYFRHPDKAALQKSALRSMLNLAQERKLPVIFHCREAYGDLLTILRDYPSLKGVIHCFSGTHSQAESFLELDFYLSFTAIITYPKNEALRSVVKTVPSDKYLLETDAPFLPPEGMRGERNDPRAVTQVAEAVAKVRGEEIDRVCRQTTDNAEALFGLNELG